MIRDILPPTTKKEALSTCSKLNKEIRDATLSRLNKYKYRNEPILSKKINSLNYEWDTERVLETHAATVVLLISIIGFSKKKCSLFILTGTVGFCLLHHALCGWCPPLPIIRKLGIRTAEEINNEKIALKIIRGDFLKVTNESEELLQIAEK